MLPRLLSFSYSAPSPKGPSGIVRAVAHLPGKQEDCSIVGRSQALLACSIVIAGCALAVLWQSPALRPAPGHRLLHIGCPPGSHGKPRYSGAGEALQRARSGEAAAADGDLASRSQTAGHPGPGQAWDASR